MKRIILFILAVSAIVTTFGQTRALVTLSRNGELKFFDKVNAFEEALDSAVNGDIIYLSEGAFSASKSNSSITINKNVRIIGNGYKSHIIPKINVATTSTFSEIFNGAPLFEGVYLESLSFNSGAENITISKSKITYFNVYYGNNIEIDRCYIGTYNNNTSSSKGVRISNSKIKTLKSYYCEIVENCNINQIYEHTPSYVQNCIINGFSSGQYSGSSNTGIYENCLIGNTANMRSDTYYNKRNCYIGDTATTPLDSNLECIYEDLLSSGYVGTDGTEVGIYGGGLPFSEIPDLPIVDSTNSSVKYDSENNKLEVTITVGSSSSAGSINSSETENASEAENSADSEN